MKNNKKLAVLAVSIVLIFLILDQILKVWVKVNMTIGEQIPLLGNWFQLYFIENEGMAFGLKFGEKFGKFLLSFIRILVVGGLIYYFIKMFKSKVLNSLTVVTLSLIITGALGNIIDSLFYGVIFDYAPFMFGHVVDMFYVKLFPIPEKFPIWGGSYFFPAIFNIADSCVTIGIILMLIFNKRILGTLQLDGSKEDNNIEQPTEG